MEPTYEGLKLYTKAGIAAVALVGLEPTYEGLKRGHPAESQSHMSLEPTYEGLKPAGSVSQVPSCTVSLEPTYEGLKHSIESPELDARRLSLEPTYEGLKLGRPSALGLHGYVEFGAYL
mgnify:CR=1 FL=1